LINLDEAIKAAMRAKDHPVLTAYRALKTKAAVKLAEAGRKGDRDALSEEEMTALVRKEIRERQESNEFLDASHPEFAVNQAIITTLETHLPAALSAEESDALIEKVIADVQPEGPRDMGKVMAALRQASPALDMAAASAKVKEHLAKLG
jgi:uncharacterized protein YqeY